MDNLTYTNTGLNIISDTINQSISFNCKNSSGKTITGMNITATDAKLYMPITLGSGSIPTLPKWFQGPHFMHKMQRIRILKMQ